MQDIDYMILENKGLVYNQLWKYHLVQDPEAESIAFEALYRAILSFDESKKTKLSTYATVYIYNALGTYVRTLNKKKQLEIISYNAVAYTDDQHSHEFVDTLASRSTVEDDYVQRERLVAIENILDMEMGTLTNQKHISIITLWKESDFTLTTSAIAKEVMVSQSYVSQVLTTFRNRLRKRLKEEL